MVDIGLIAIDIYKRLRQPSNRQTGLSPPLRPLCLPETACRCRTASAEPATVCIVTAVVPSASVPESRPSSEKGQRPSPGPK